MARYSDKKLLSLKDLIRFFDSEYGFRPHYSTIWRWRSAGANGVRLQYIQAGGHKYSSVGHVREFMEKLNTPSDESVSIPVMPPRQAEAAALRSAKKLHERLKTRKK
jgi:hypothetical protein